LPALFEGDTHIVISRKIKEAINMANEDLKVTISADKKAQREKILKERNEAFNLLKQCVDASKDDKFINALKHIKPSLYGGRTFGPRESGKALHNSVVTEITLAGKMGLSEDTLWKKFKTGRKEVNNLIKQNLRVSAPDKRTWISFSSEKGTYTVISTGKIPPKEYAGYIPVDESVSLK
jgi:tRNA(Glu) U13 pseudouridine synthase TruD